jgi:uncharacterized protein
MSDDVTLADVPEAERYELHVGSELAGYLEYRGRGDVRALVHTEIDPAFEGRGLGGRLVRFVLDDARAKGRTIVPICPFVHSFLAEHNEYLDLMQPHIRKAFGL